MHVATSAACAAVRQQELLEFGNFLGERRTCAKQRNGTTAPIARPRARGETHEHLSTRRFGREEWKIRRERASSLAQARRQVVLRAPPAAPAVAQCWHRRRFCARDNPPRRLPPRLRAALSSRFCFRGYWAFDRSCG